MPEVVVSFLDGEILYGELPQLQMDDPFVDLDLNTLDGNSRQALVPVSGVRQIELAKVDPQSPDLDLEQTPRVALHFIDGQVVRAHVLSPASLQRFGAIWDIVDANSQEHKVCAIPYTALKGAFYVRHWDTRPPLERTSSVGGVNAQQRRRLAEIQARRNREGMLGRLKRPGSGLLGRVEGGPGAPRGRGRRRPQQPPEDPEPQ
ncbi:MAG: hypothetical protein ACREN7_10130 [Candidatus Dormibacteria bacterium]